MNTSQAIANRFREVILNGTWVANTNFKQQLSGLQVEEATRKVDGLNTIALLAQHIHYYVKGVCTVLKGGSLDISDKYSFDFPSELSQSDWDNFLTRFWSDAEEFAQHVERLSDDQLQAVFVDEKYGTYGRNIECMIEHSYYHLGQISLIRKLIEASS